jgi:DNA-binding transcriptional ArsR family regulator
VAETLSDAELATVAELMRTLGHETRLRLLDTLRVKGETSVGELETLTGIGQPGLSQQLAILRKAALVTTRRAAKLVYYSIAPEAAGTANTFLARLSEMPERGDRTPRRARGAAATFAKIL